MNTASAAAVCQGRGFTQHTKALPLMDAPFAAGDEGHTKALPFLMVLIVCRSDRKNIQLKGDFMVRSIIHDTMLLSRRAAPADKNDLTTARDLADTLRAHAAGCAGMAANMIGVHKRIIAVMIAEMPVVMLNPVITGHSAESYEAEEGCLSLSGVRPVRRFRWVEVSYDDMLLKKRKAVFRDFIAEVVQHEIDHCNGILI